MPSVLATRPGHAHVAVASLETGDLSLLDARGLDVIASAKGLAGPHDLRFDPDGERLHVSLLDEPALLTFDADTLALLSRLDLPDATRGLDHTSNTIDGLHGLAVSPGAPSVWRLDMRGEPSLIGRADLPSPVSRAFTGPRGELAWMPSTERPELYRMVIETGEWTTVPLPALPARVAFEPLADTLLISTEGGLVRLDREGNVLERSGLLAGPGFAVEGFAATLLLTEGGRVHRQGSHEALRPRRTDVLDAHTLTTASALSYCH